MPSGHGARCPRERPRPRPADDGAHPAGAVGRARRRLGARPAVGPAGRAGVHRPRGRARRQGLRGALPPHPRRERVGPPGGLAGDARGAPGPPVAVGDLGRRRLGVPGDRRGLPLGHRLLRRAAAGLLRDDLRHRAAAGVPAHLAAAAVARHQAGARARLDRRRRGVRADDQRGPLAARRRRGRPGDRGGGARRVVRAVVVVAVRPALRPGAVAGARRAGGGDRRGDVRSTRSRRPCGCRAPWRPTRRSSASSGWR